MKTTALTRNDKTGLATIKHARALMMVMERQYLGPTTSPATRTSVVDEWQL